MNIKKRFLMFAAILSFCGITSASANDYRDMEPLKLTVPEMTPTLVTVTNNSYRPELELDDHAPWAKENWTWMRTNPGVKPYKVMDDLTFVGVPVFLAGIIAKSEKAAFRQNTGDNKHVLLTDFKTGIDDYSQFFGPVMTTGLKIAGVESRFPRDFERSTPRCAGEFEERQEEPPHLYPGRLVHDLILKSSNHFMWK